MQEQELRALETRLRQQVELGRRARAFLDSPGAAEFLRPYPQARRLELLEQFKRLVSLDRDKFLTASLAIKAGIEEADAFTAHLEGLAQAGETALFELGQLINGEEQEQETGL